MDIRCESTAVSVSKEFMLEFTRKATKLMVPLSGAIELTHRCNLRCIHCYVASGPSSLRDQELDTGRFLSILDEITDAGCFELLITGGEPLLRLDFSEIYRHAKMNGLIVTVFTNGTLITDDIVALFVQYPPYLVEISLYGASAETYEGITGVKGSYAQCIAGIKRLLSAGIRVKLKTMLMTLNSQELAAMEEMARHYGVSFRMDAALFPRFNGDRAPLDLRVPPFEAVEREFADNGRLESWLEFYKRGEGGSVSGDLYVCGAGTTGFHIDTYGLLSPCLMVKNIAFDLSGGSFQAGWNRTIVEIGKKKASPAYACKDCECYSLCGACPAFFELENGAEEIHSEYLCAIGKERNKKLEYMSRISCLEEKNENKRED